MLTEFCGIPTPAGIRGAPARITEMRSSLFALGDCLGVAGAEARAKSLSQELLEKFRDHPDPVTSKFSG